MLAWTGVVPSADFIAQTRAESPKFTATCHRRGFLARGGGAFLSRLENLAAERCKRLRLRPAVPMGAGHSALVTQQQADDDEPLIPDVGIARWPTTLQHIDDTPDDALATTYETVGGQPVVTLMRNHMPHTAVPEEDTGNLPFSDAVPAPAKLKFVDAEGRTCAVLMNGPNGDNTRSGPQLIDQYGVEIGFAALSGYRNGEGRGVLYAATPRVDPDIFYQALPSATAEECGLCEEQCSICMVDYSPTEELKVLPCCATHAFHPGCIREWLHKRSSCPLCRTASSDDDGHGPQHENTIVSESARSLLWPIGHIRPVMTKAQQHARGYESRHMGGVGFYRILPDASVNREAELVFDGTRVKNARKECVARCAPWHGKRPGTKKLTVAPGVDAVIVLALTSEWDANRRGVASS